MADTYVQNLVTPLSIGAATSDLQTAGNTLLTLINNKLVNNYGSLDNALRTAAQISNSTGPVAFDTGVVNSQTLRVVLPTNQPAIPVLQSLAPWTFSLPTGASTALNQTAANNILSTINNGIPVGLGPKSMVNSMSVVLASDQPLVVSQASATNFNAQIVGNIANAAADSGNPVKMAAVYNLNAPVYANGQRANLQSDVRGAVYVNRESRKKTYCATISNLILVASATDFFTITGATNTIVKIQSIFISAQATNNIIPDVILLKRSAANTNGIFTTPTVVPYDSSDGAPAATIRAYTGNPVTGTLVGNMKSVNLFFSGANANPAQFLGWKFDEASAKYPTLNNASEVIALNLGGVTVAGGSMDIDIVWTEE